MTQAVDNREWLKEAIPLEKQDRSWLNEATEIGEFALEDELDYMNDFYRQTSLSEKAKQGALAVPKGLAYGTEQMIGGGGSFVRWMSEKATLGGVVKTSFFYETPGADIVAEHLIRKYGPKRPIEFYDKMMTFYAKQGKKFADFMDEQANKGWEAPNQEILRAKWSERPISKAVQVTSQAAPNYLAAIGLSVLTKNPQVGLVFLSELSGAQAYEKQREKGTGMWLADKIATMTAAWEYVTEKIPFDEVFKPAKSKFLKMAKIGTMESAQEFFQGLGENFLEYFGYNAKDLQSIPLAAREGIKHAFDGWMENVVAGFGLGAVGGGIVSNEAIKARAEELKAKPPEGSAVAEAMPEVEKPTEAKPVPPTEVQPAPTEKAELKKIPELEVWKNDKYWSVKTKDSKNYLLDAAGHIKLFRTEQSAREEGEKWFNKKFAGVKPTKEITPEKAEVVPEVTPAIAEEEEGKRQPYPSYEGDQRITKQGPAYAPIEDVDAFEKLRDNQIEWNKKRTTKLRKSEIIEESKNLKAQLVKKGYEPDFIKAVEMEDAGIPIPSKTEQVIEEMTKPKEGIEPSGGVAWQTAFKTGLENAEKQMPKVKREQKKTRKQRVGAAAGTLEYLRGKGLSGKEAIGRSMGKLRGQLTDYVQRYIALDDVVSPATIEAALDDIADNTNLTYFDRINLTNPDNNGAFDKFRMGTALTRGEVNLIKKWSKVIGEIAEKRIPVLNRVFAHIEDIIAFPKEAAALDIQMRRQAGWLRGRHPVLYGKAIGKNLLAYMNKKYADNLAEQVEDSPNHEDARNHGVRFLERAGEGENPEQYFSRIPGKIPKVGKIYVASMRGFIDSYNWMQQALWDNKIETWTQKGVDITDEMKYDLADFDNTMLGMSPAKSNFGRAARRVLSPVMWSPTLTWSRIRTPSMLFTNPTMRAEVALTLSSYVGSGLFMMMAASLIAKAFGRKEPCEWDSRSVDFGKVRIGDTRFDVFGDGGTYIRALMQLIYAEKKNQAGRLRNRPRIEVIKQFVRNKRAPIFDFLAKIWTGRTYYGGPAFELPDWEKAKAEGGIRGEIVEKLEGTTESEAGKISFIIGKEIFDTFAPFFVNSFFEAAWNDGLNVGIVAGTDEFFSGQTLSYAPSDFAEMQILQDTVATDKYDRLWDDLSPNQQEVLMRQYPAIKELEIKADEEKLPPEEINLKEQNEAAEKVTKLLPDDIQNVLKDSNVRVSGLSRRIGKFWLNNDRYELYQIYSAEEIQKQLKTVSANKRWANYDSLKKKQYINDRIDKAKERARNRLLLDIRKSTRQ